MSPYDNVVGLIIRWNLLLVVVVDGGLDGECERYSCRVGSRRTAPAAPWSVHNCVVLFSVLLLHLRASLVPPSPLHHLESSRIGR